MAGEEVVGGVEGAGVGVAAKAKSLGGLSSVVASHCRWQKGRSRGGLVVSVGCQWVRQGWWWLRLVSQASRAEQKMNVR